MSTGKLITPKQCKAARALLGWTQADLSSKSRVGMSTIKNFEASHKKTIFSVMQSLRITLEEAGVEFLGTRGVQLKKG